MGNSGPSIFDDSAQSRTRLLIEVVLHFAATCIDKGVACDLRDRSRNSRLVLPIHPKKSRDLSRTPPGEKEVCLKGETDGEERLL